MEKAEARGIAGFFSRHRILLLLLLTNILFALIYRRFLTGESVYMYADIGNDSLSSSYPILMMVSRLLHSGTLSHYTLTMGIGNDITGILLQYLNPVKLLIVLFPPACLTVGILVSTIVQVNLLSLFSYLYFRTLLKNETAALFTGLAFSFSSYAVLWGQNYSFLTCLLLFAAVMYFLEVYLDDGPRKIYLLFIPCTGLFLISNYYFLYMTAFFAFFYIIIASLIRRKGAAALFRKLLGTAGMAVFGAGVGFISLLPTIRSFTGSNRTTASRAGLSVILTPYDLRNALTTLGRFFSTDLFGSGSGYTGASNYYEASVLTVTALFLFAFTYLIWHKKSRLPAALIGLVSVLMLSVPLTSHLLTFNASAHRWTFFLCLAELIAVGFFLRSLFSGADEEALKKTLFTVPLLCLALLAAIFYGRMNGYYYISKKPLAICAAVFAAYFLLLLFRRKLTRLFPVLLMGVLMAELFLLDNLIVNERLYVTSAAFDTLYYHDGASEAVDAVTKADDSLYRICNYRMTDENLFGISATADKMFANESMVDNYLSSSVYSNMISKTYSSYSEAVNGDQGFGNFFIVDYQNYYLYTLLGGKYLIGEKANPVTDEADSDLFEKDGTASTRAISRNRNALSFGYLYTQEISGEDFAALSPFARMRAETQAFVDTDDFINAEDASAESTSADAASHTVTSDASADSAAADSADSTADASAAENVSADGFAESSEVSADTEIRLSDIVHLANDCTWTANGDSLSITATGSDPYVLFMVPEFADGQSAYLDIAADLPADREKDLELFYATKKQPNMSPAFRTEVFMTKSGADKVLLMPEEMTFLRIDLQSDTSIDLTLALLCTADTVSDFTSLQASGATDISFADDTYSAKVSCSADKGMLCIPIPYSSKWTAYVNGRAVTVRNINGGLCGIEVPSGTSSVTMTWHDGTFLPGVIGSFIFLAAFLVLYFFPKKKRLTR